MSSKLTTLALLLSLSSLSQSNTINEIQTGQSIHVSQALLSPDGAFKLGFFRPRRKESRYFVGIWFANISESDDERPNISELNCVWVANRDYPALSSSATLSVRSDDGNIVISDGKMSYDVTNVTSSASNSSNLARVSNSGNLVLLTRGGSENKNSTGQRNNESVLWESFDHPTNTLLPGVKMKVNAGDSSSPAIMVSWKGKRDPSPGKYSLRLVKENFLIMEGNKTFSVLEGNKGMVYYRGGYIFYDRKVGSSEIFRVVLTDRGELIEESWNEKIQCWRKDAKCRKKGCQQSNFTRNAVIITIVTVFVVISLLAGFYFLRKKKFNGKGENLLKFDVEMSLKHNSQELPELNNKRKKGRKKMGKLIFFSLSSVSKATDGFSDANKVGQGGFGPVYKGTLLNGDEVAVKRLSKNSRQGKQQLKTEANLIARLQHKNLVRVLGCCVEKKEQILIYEYMHNKSLDFYLYDTMRRRILTWPVRARIVEGVAQGLLYLHKYSRIKIIHRDLKPGNVLLDNDMNPKISDFGMARIFSVNDLQEGSTRPVGTFGYMSPEAGRHGVFSEKSDIYSFGVLFLEILSGKKNTETHSTDTAGLVAYAWELWRNDRSMELLDPLVEENPPIVKNACRYVQIALLCVQELPADRPSMARVLSMLCNSKEVLPYPNQPGFLDSTNFVRSRPMTKNAAEPSPQEVSVNEVTLSSLEPR